MNPFQLAFSGILEQGVYFPRISLMTSKQTDNKTANNEYIYSHTQIIPSHITTVLSSCSAAVHLWPLLCLSHSAGSASRPRSTLA